MGRKKKNKVDKYFYDLVQKKYINIRCTICKKNIVIRVNDPKIYTKEILDKYICILCKCRKNK